MRFLGPLARDVNLRLIVRLIAAADVFCSFYDFSNVGFALLEAMSCGVAIVATDSGATRDFVIDGVHGIVVPHRDDGAAAEAVVRLLDDPELRRRLGEQAKSRARSEFASREARKRLELALLDEVAPAPRP